MEVELYFRFQILSKMSTARDYIRRVVHLGIDGIACFAAPTIDASGCGRYTLHSPHPSLSSRPIRLFTDWLFSFISKSHSSLEIDFTLHWGYQNEM